MISEFKGEYYFLSNFYPCRVHFNGFDFSSSEAAYQASKCKTLTEQGAFTYLSANDAKRKGRQVELRPDWESVKLRMMERVITAKFTQNPDLMDKLLNTGTEELVEGNYWGDTYWGVCNGVGENHLGKLLMELRQSYINRRSK